MSKDINPFTNADETARRHADANEAVLSTVENLSSDETMAAVSDVDKDSKYACRVPANLTVQEGDSVIVDTAAGGRPFVTAIVERTAELSTGDEYTKTDDYTYFTVGNDNWRMFRVDEDHKVEFTGGFRGDANESTAFIDSVYAVEEDEFWVTYGGSNLELYSDGTTVGYIINGLFILNDPFGASSAINSLAWDSNNEHIIGAYVTGSDLAAVGAIEKVGAGNYNTVWETTVGSSTTAFGLTVDYASDGFVYVTSPIDGEIYQLNESGTVQNTTAFSNPVSCGVRPDQKLIVLHNDGTIYRYEDSLTLEDSRNNLFSGNGHTVYTTGENGAVAGLTDGVYAVDDSLGYDWAIPSSGTVTVRGSTPQDRVYIENEYDSAVASTTVEVSSIDVTTGNEIYTHQRNEYDIQGFRAVVAERPGAYPGEFN